MYLHIGGGGLYYNLSWNQSIEPNTYDLSPLEPRWKGVPIVKMGIPLVANDPTAPDPPHTVDQTVGYHMLPFYPGHLLDGVVTLKYHVTKQGVTIDNFSTIPEVVDNHYIRVTYCTITGEEKPSDITDMAGEKVYINVKFK